MPGLLAQLFGLTIKLVLALFFYATPLVGFWVASSLAAYLGGPHYLPWLAGALLFPVLPGFWELYAWSHRDPAKKAWLTPLDRLSLRTFVVGLVFLLGLLSVYPQAAFVALSTRGDWMLDDVKDGRVPEIRRTLFTAAGGLEWLYKLTKTNPYKNCIDAKARQSAEEAGKEREREVEQDEKGQSAISESSGSNGEQSTAEDSEQSDQSANELAFKPNPIDDSESASAGSKHGSKTGESESKSKTQSGKKKSDGNDPDAESKELGKLTDSSSDADPGRDVSGLAQVMWPWQSSQGLHPAVVNMPASAEKSIKSVAQYIAKQEKDPVLRVKALHDYVADRIAYDADAYYSGNIPDQDAETTFRKRKSVCAGYANLLSALGDAIHEKIIVVVGDARDDKGDKLSGQGHAWNAAQIGKKWYLIDACWDSGFTSREKGFEKAYRTDYLLPPPVVMVQDHFPDDANWQLLAKPLTQGDFLRQPMLRPLFNASEFTLIAPTRACNETDSSKARVVIRNPRRRWLMPGLEQSGVRLDMDSTETNNATAYLEYTLPKKGTYRFNIFESKAHYGSYDFVGSVDFVNR